MNRKKDIAIKCLKAAFIGLVLLLLYAPIVLLAAYSFIGTDQIGTSGEFSFVHYQTLFSEPKILTMIGNTLLLALLAATLSTILGTAGALGIYYSKKRTKTVINGVSQIPIINAEIVTALALAITFVAVGLGKSYFTMLIGHMVICTPFEKPAHFYYNQKINCMRAEGTVRIGGEEYRFDPKDSFAVLDWGRGVWTYHNTWYWGSASGLAEGWSSVLTSAMALGIPPPPRRICFFTRARPTSCQKWTSESPCGTGKRIT